MDSETSLESLKKLVAKFRDERDWKQFHNPKDLAISISIEANELLELFQWKSKEEIKELQKDHGKMDKIREELADIIIYCLLASESMNIDLSTVIKQKLEKNAKKYPVEKAKGSNKKYTEM